jgi:hypothetical protein
MCHQAQFTLSNTTLQKERMEDKDLHGPEWRRWMEKCGFSSTEIDNHTTFTFSKSELLKLSKIYSPNNSFMSVELKSGSCCKINYCNLPVLYGRIVNFYKDNDHIDLSKISIRCFINTSIMHVFTYYFTLSQPDLQERNLILKKIKYGQSAPLNMLTYNLIFE